MLEKLVAQMVKEKIEGKQYKKLTFIEMVTAWVQQKLN